MSSMAYFSPSRPSPEALTPPYGMWSMRYVGTSLMTTPPTSMFSKAARAFSSELVKTPAWRPYSESLSLRIASPNDFTGAIVTSGANASFEQTKLDGIGVLDHGRLEEPPVSRAASQDPCAIGRRIVDPGLGSRHGLLVDHRTEIGRAVERVAKLNRLDRVDQLLAELLVDLFDDEDALHRDADLTGVGKGADADPVHGEIEIGVGVDDHAGVAAELENDLLHPGAALHLPTDVRRAGEGEQLEARVLDQGVADFAIHRHDADRALRHARRLDNLGEEQHGQRIARGRLEHDRVAGGDRRRDLVQRQVERES